MLTGWLLLTKPRTILMRNPYILMHGGKTESLFKSYPAWGGGNNSKCIWAMKLKFSGFSNKHMPINLGWAFIPTAWVLRHTALMPYFPCTRINLNLDLISVIWFQHFKTLWKAHDKSKQEILHRSEIAHFQFFLNYTYLGFKNLVKVLHICICWVKDFTKMYYLLQFEKFLPNH